MSGSIIGIGVDLVELERIAHILARHRRRFVERICRPDECERRQGDALVQHVGGLFAAKEAVLKALGTGWREGLRFRDVEIHKSEHGAPLVSLHDAAQARAEALGVDSVHVSISHERAYAVAFAILEGVSR